MRPVLQVLLAIALLLVTLAGCLGKDGPAPADSDSPTPAPSEPYQAFLPPEGNLTTPTRVAGPVNFLVTTDTGPANELTIAVNPRDPNNLVAGGKDYALGTDHPCPATPSGSPEYPINVWTGVYWSKDGGKTWKNALMPGHPEDSANATHPNHAWPCNSDPVVVFGQDGTAYFSGLGIRGNNVPDPESPCVQGSSSIWIMKSSDGGETWSDFSCVAAGTNVARAGGFNVDKQWFAVDGENVYFTYMAFGPAYGTSAGFFAYPFDLIFRRSTDGGQSWGPERILFESPSQDEPDAFLDERQFSTPAVDSDGNLFVTFRNFGRFGGVYFTRSLDQGLTFDPVERIADVVPLPGTFAGDEGYRVSSYPVLAADATNGNHSGDLHVVWSDFGEGDADILYMRSEDAGATWSEPARLNGDEVGNRAHQFLPWVTVGPDGNVHVGWLDNRSYANASRLDFFFRTSADGGTTWSPELRVNAEPIATETCRHQSGREFIGDYLGLAASEKAVHPFWPDGSSGRCNGMTAVLVR